MDVWLNGQFVPIQDARINALDAGLQHGIGIFDTAIAANGRVFRARQHMQRLARSALELDLSMNLRVPPLVRALHQVLERNTLAEARLRITITAGCFQNPLSRDHRRTDPTILIVAQTPTRYPDRFFESGVRVEIADDRENAHSAFSGHKILNYWPRIRALQVAARADAAEALWFSASGQVVSGSVSNIFVVSRGSLLTPPSLEECTRNSSVPPALPGITRQVVCEIAAERQIPFAVRLLTIDDILGADEVFLTNSSWGILPVTAIEDRGIASRKVGTLTRDFRSDLLRRIQLETLAPPDVVSGCSEHDGPDR